LLLVLFLAACSSTPKVDVGSAAAVGASGSTGLSESKGAVKSDIKYDNDPGWKVIFSEKFDDNSQKWDLTWNDGKYVSFQASIADGVYKETLNGKAAGNFLNAGIHSIVLGKATDVYIGVTGKVDSKFKNSSWGIGFMADEERNSYVEFNLLRDSYKLFRHNKDALIKDNVLESKVTDKIQIGVMNTLELKKEGDFLEYFFNGKSFAKYSLSEMQYPGKNVYLFFLVDEGASATFTVDNILLESKQ
jgi:hypothetical protein